MTRLADPLRAAFLAASGHADGWEAVAAFVEERLRQPRGWANPPACVVCGERGTVAEVRCRKHEGRPEVVVAEGRCGTCGRVLGEDQAKWMVTCRECQDSVEPPKASEPAAPKVEEEREAFDVPLPVETDHPCVHEADGKRCEFPAVLCEFHGGHDACAVDLMQARASRGAVDRWGLATTLQTAFYAAQERDELTRACWLAAADAALRVVEGKS